MLRACGGGGWAREHYSPSSGRSLLGAAAALAPPVEAPSFEAQRAHLERALGATTTVLFLASVSYVALTTVFGCLCAGGGSRRRGREQPAAAEEETKRALEEIPVVVVAVPARDLGRGGGGGDEPEREECAVCLAEYAGGEEVRVLPACRHGFHRECVDRWLLTRAPTCPVCRATVAARAEGNDAKACARAGGAALPASGS